MSMIRLVQRIMKPGCRVEVKHESLQEKVCGNELASCLVSKEALE